MHDGHDGWAMHHKGSARCEKDACTYAGRCFSNGAIHVNGGACQQCNAAQWVGATGCSVEGCGMGKDRCRMKHCRSGDGKPCDGGRGQGRRHHPEH